MRYKELGNTGVKIPVIGQGSIGAGSRKSAGQERVRKRLDVFREGINLGMTLLDTGEDYEDGYAEVLVGRAVRGIRERVFLSSKFKPANSSGAGVLRAIDGSLKRLNTDYIDLYQIQWPNPSVPVAETMSALSRLISAGKVRYAGVCNFSLKQLKEARAVFKGKIVSIQTEYNLRNRSMESELLPFCSRNNMTVIAYDLFSQGGFYLNEVEREILEAIARKHAATVFQVVIAWAVSKPHVVALTNTMNVDHIRENALAADIKLDAEDIRKIEDAFYGEPVMVPADRIRVLPDDADVTHVIYTSVQQALKNEAGLQPSPAALAEEIKSGNLQKPVELVSSGDKSGKYDFDLIGGRNRYWAWVIAYGEKSLIHAYITDGTVKTNRV